MSDDQDGTYSFPLDQTIMIDSSNDYDLSLTANNWSNIYVGDGDLSKYALRFDDDALISFGDDFEIEARQLKACLKVLLKMAKDECPEEFI